MNQLNGLNRAEFVHRVITGAASNEEVDRVMTMAAAALREIAPAAYEYDYTVDEKATDDVMFIISDLLDVLRYARDTSYKDLVASFLNGSAPAPAAISLSILGYFYGLTSEYASQIAELIRGAPWDPLNEVQEVATLVAADYLKTNKQPILLSALIDTIEEPIVVAEQHLAAERRMNAFGALEILVASGAHEAISPLAIRHNLAIHTSIDETVVQAAKRRLAKELENGSNLKLDRPEPDDS